MMGTRLFESFFMGGFESSTHRLKSGRRLDEIDATAHERFAMQDYFRLQSQGMATARDGLRWHLIEHSPGQYDFSSVLPMIEASRATRTQVIWDLCHYGWPDGLDIFKPDFIESFRKFARAFGQLWKEETDEILFVTPINEISFLSWAAGEVGIINPFKRKRGAELKEQLVRASIAAIEELWYVDSRTRFASIDPLINVVAANPQSKKRIQSAEGYRVAQFEAWDMLAGLQKPHLGGAPKYLDIVGGNYYIHNQWVFRGSFITQDDPRYRSFREILLELYQRYERPIFVAETGIEDDLRPSWFRYVCDEVFAAIESGVPVQGICLYPIVNHPGWDDDRHCFNGLWDYPDENGERVIYQPLADELQQQRSRFAASGIG
jgi:beta-glucosidase/6-phospho-beta-glucosidase/beta-galactosidase